jgi:hypothetical protein
MDNDTRAWCDELEVDELPSCLFCGAQAQFNARTQADLWCYLCEACFMEYGLGLGPLEGQRLLLKPRGQRERVGLKEHCFD